MDKQELYLITSMGGYTPNIGRLVSMMNNARYTTVKSVEGLTVDELDYLIDDGCNSIGALLLHIAAVDYYYRTVTMEDREPTKEELTFWEPALALGDQRALRWFHVMEDEINHRGQIRWMAKRIKPTE